MQPAVDQLASTTASTAAAGMTSLGRAAIAVVLGLIWRLAPLHLPPAAHKYGGSALYAIMFYWLFAAGWPRLRPLAIAGCSFATVTAVEFFKLVRTPALDAFRLTLPGQLTLGRIFTLGAIVAYALAIGLTGWYDVSRRN